MAVFRCPKCAVPMTDAEIPKGVCPICETAFEAPAPTPAGPRPRPPEPPAGFSTAGIVALAVCVAAFCIFPVGLMFYFGMPEVPEKKHEEKKTPVLAEVKKSKGAPAPDKSAKKDDQPKVQPPEEKKSDPKPADKWKEDVKKETVKKEEPKKIERRKAEKKKEEAKVIVKNLEPAPNKRPNVPRFAVLPFLDDDAIRIDGDLTDWKDVAPLTLQAVARGKETKKVVHAPKTQKAFAAYCKRGIVLGFEVVDTSGALENEPPQAINTRWDFWDRDAVEVFIDTLNTRSRERGEPNAHQFFAFPFSFGEPANIGGFESRMLTPPGGRMAWAIVPIPGAGKVGMVRAGKKTAAGWSMELLIPKTHLRKGDLKPGQTYGFELQLDTGTNLYYFWANEDPVLKVSTIPARWGEVLLAGADAKFDLFAGGKPANVLTPGQPLSVRVTDLDASAGSAVKRKVAVALTARSGDKATLPLVETANGSGIFAGTISTRLATGKRQANVLEVFADDVVVIEYVDEFRADGERNKKVSASISVKGR